MDSIIIIAVVLSLVVLAVILGVYWLSLRKKASPAANPLDPLAHDFVYANDDNYGFDTIIPAKAADLERPSRD